MNDRDHFAAAALTGLLSHSVVPSQVIDTYSQIAFQYADAMLRERAKHWEGTSNSWSGNWPELSNGHVAYMHGGPPNHDAAPVGVGFEDYADEHSAIEDQLRSLGLPLPDSDCMPTTDELSAVMVEEIKRLRLTDAEREAIHNACKLGTFPNEVATLHGLLERLK